MRTIQKVILFLLCVCSISCLKKNEQPAQKTPDFLVSEQTSGVSWQKTDNRIVLVFGYGYTDSPFYESLLSVLETRFGLDRDGGLILPLAFPDDFNYEGNAGRISSLPDIIAGKNVIALITVGAPESTHRALAVIQDRSITDASFTFPVYSLFPQDDVMGIEAGSHVVINFAPFGSTQGLGEESGLQHLDLVPSILVSLISKASDFPRNASSTGVQKFLTSMFGPLWQVEVNIDPETSLRSKNHFLISLQERDDADEPAVSGIFLLNGE